MSTMACDTKATRVISVEARLLRIHPYAQRRLVVANVKRIASALDLDAIGTLHGVEYEIDGVEALWIVDGQTRLKALLEVGLGDWAVDVLVHTDIKDHARAAELFLKLNARATMQAYDRFSIAVTAERNDAVGVLRIVTAHNLTVVRNGGDGLISCVTTLLKIFNVDAGELLAATMATAIAAWGHIASACEGRVLEGLSVVLKTYGENIDSPALIKKLSKYPGGPSALLGDARGIKARRRLKLSRCVAVQIVEAYNVGRRADKLDPL